MRTLHKPFSTCTCSSLSVTPSPLSQFAGSGEELVPGLFPANVAERKGKGQKQRH